MEHSHDCHLGNEQTLVEDEPTFIEVLVNTVVSASAIVLKHLRKTSSSVRFAWFDDLPLTMTTLTRMYIKGQRSGVAGASRPISAKEGGSVTIADLNHVESSLLLK